MTFSSDDLEIIGGGDSLPEPYAKMRDFGLREHQRVTQEAVQPQALSSDDLEIMVEPKAPAAPAKRAKAVPGEEATLVTSMSGGFGRAFQGLQAIALQQGQRFIDMLNRIDLGKEPAEGYDPVARQVLALTPAERAALRREAKGSVDERSKRIAEIQQTIDTIPRHEATERLTSAQGFDEVWAAFTSNPLAVIGHLGAESFPQMIPGLAGAAIAGPVGGVVAGSAALGAGSALGEYGSSILQSLQEAGVDLRNADSVRRATSDPQIMAAVRDKAMVRAGVIGAFDAASGGVASRTLAPARMASRPLAREAVNLAAQAPAQGAMGAAGEAAASLAVGEQATPGALAGEFFGEFVTAPADVAAMASTRRPQAAPAPVPGAPGEAQGEPVDAGEVLGAAPAGGAPAPPAEAIRQVSTMQPRDRDRAASVAQMQSIANAPDFDRLATAPTPTDGAPLVSAKGDQATALKGREDVVTFEGGMKVPVTYAVVEADSVLASNTADGRQVPEYFGELAPGTLRALNNGRTAGVQAAYDRGTAASYREKLVATAPELGLDPAQVNAFERPLLIRLYPDRVNDEVPNLGELSNAGGGMRLGPVEQARADALKIQSLAGLAVNDEGVFDARGSAAFVKRFLATVPPNDLNQLVDAEGQLSSAGLARIRNAIFAKAYGGGAALDRVLESSDSNVRNITNGMMKAAPRLAEMRTRMEAGTLDPSLDLTGDFVTAVEEFSKLRAAGSSVAEYLAQGDMLGRPFDDEVIELMARIEAMARSGRAVADFLGNYVDEVEATGNPGQGALVPPPQITGTDLLQKITRPVEADYAARAVATAPDMRAAVDQASALTEQTGQLHRARSVAGQWVVVPEETEPKKEAKREEPVPAAQQADDRPAGARAQVADQPEAAPRGAEQPAQAGEDVDAAAHEAATSPENALPDPTDAQKEAGNYKKGHVNVAGLEISIENPEGSKRRPEWPTLKSHYGYILGTIGRDKDHLDIFVKPGTPADYEGPIFVVDQVSQDGKFDEHKIMLGWDTEEAARAGYKENYTENFRVGPITGMALDEFKAWIASGDTKRPLAPQAPAPQASKPADVPRAGNLRSDELEVETRVAEKIGADFDAAVREYEALEDTHGGTVLSTDEARALSPDYAAGKEGRTKWANAVHEPVSWFIKTLYERKLREPAPAGKDDLVVFTAGGTGAGKTSGIQSLPAMKAVTDQAHIVYDTNMNTYASAKKKMEQALAAGKDVVVMFVYRDPIDALRAGALPRAMKKGRTIQLRDHEGTHKGVVETLPRLMNDFAGNKGVRFYGVDNTRGAGQAQVVPVETLTQKAYSYTREDLEKSLDEARAGGEISDAVYYAFRGEAAPERAGGTGQDRPADGRGDGQGAERGGSPGRDLVAGRKPKAPQAPSSEGARAYGATNKIVTPEAAQAARELLRRNLARLNSGLDPELAAAALKLATFHIEAGARSFAAFSKAMIEDLGAAIKPYLKGLYDQVRASQGSLFGPMDGPGTTAIAEQTRFKPTPEQKARGAKAKATIAAAAQAGFDFDAPQAENEAVGGSDHETRPNQGSDPGEDAGSAGRPTQGSGDPGSDVAGDGGRPGKPGGRRDGESGERPEAAKPADGDAAHPGDGRRGARGARDTSLKPRISRGRTDNYRFGEDDLSAKGGALTRARHNVEAVALLKRLEAEGRQATPEEQTVLARFIGWGWSEIRNGIFPANKWELKGEWAPLRERLEELLSEEELEAAQRSTQYAHYTSKEVVRAMWRAMERMGFAGGQVLEPGMGIGNFPGLMPDAIAQSSVYTGIEFDPITGGIARQLFPAENIKVESFVDTALPHDFFDVAIGNPPFAPTKILADPEYRKRAFALHDYFFAKTIDRVRPGGLVAFVTSRYTMDKANDRARAYLAERANLVGAIRLPQTAFMKNAGTEVVTDVLFLQKRGPGIEDNGVKWAGLQEVTTPEGPAAINEYFAAHPEMVLGTHALTGTMYRAGQYTVLPLKSDIEADFAKAVENLPEGIFHAEAGSQAAAAATIAVDFNPKALKEGGYYVDDKGLLRVRDQGVGKTPKEVLGRDFSKKEEAQARDYVVLRDALKSAFHDQLTDSRDWEKSLKALQRAYRTFVDKNGRLNQFKIQERVEKHVDEDGNEVAQPVEKVVFSLDRTFRHDPDWTLVSALEAFDEDTRAVKESAFLRERVLNKPTAPKVETPQDALMVTLAELGRVDIGIAAERIGLTQRAFVESLGDALYEDPSAGWTTADAYLSGDVKKKLAAAQEAAKTDPRFRRNVEALKNLQPRSLAPSEITAQIGANWIPAKVYVDFAKEQAGVTLGIERNDATGEWNVDAVAGYGTAAATTEWGTPRRPFHNLMAAALNKREVKVFDRDREGKEHLNAVETEAAQDKLRKIKEAFATFVWSEPTRADELVGIYNRKFNRLVHREFDGSHLTLPGVTLKFKPHAHVKRAVWRIIQQGNVYLAHAVGAGKTAEMVIGGMEEKRLGLIKKPMYVVPNHMLKQFAAEFQEIYPTAKIMVADERQFHTDNRRRFVARVALSDLDAVVITQSAFKILGLDPAFQAKLIERELDMLREILSDIDKHERVKRRQIEQMIEKLEQKLAKAMTATRKDTNVRFDEMGVDKLYVDEAHQYRKLTFGTNMGTMKGIDPAGSDYSWDLYTKVRWLEEHKNAGRSLVMASGTPIVNTLAELFTVQRFMDPKALEERGIERFDDWASMFGSEKTSIEADAAGGYKPVTRFSKFVNVGELGQMFREFADVITTEKLGVLLTNRPKVKGGGRSLVALERTPELADYQQVLKERMQAIKDRAGPPEKGDDILLAVITDGRIATVDMRYHRRMLPPNPQSKLNRAIASIAEIYKRTADFEYVGRDGKPEPNKGAAQMVFSDVGFGEGVMARGFNAREWFVNELVRQGVKREHIAFMGDYKKSDAKLRLFRDLNTGRMRILVGSSKNMGTGVNAQQRLFAMHHLDAPWFPADLQQREGRIVRHGNKNKEVEIYAWATKGTYDTVMWQMLATKQAFVDQMLQGNRDLTEIEDVSEADQYTIAVAMTAGDERAILLAGLKADISKLERLYQSHIDNQQRMRRGIAIARNDIEQSEKHLKPAQDQAAKVRDLTGDKFVMRVGKVTYKSRAEAGKALNDAFHSYAMALKEKTEEVGEISGFPITLHGEQLKNTGGKVVNYSAAVKLDRKPYPVTILGELGLDPVGVAMRLQNAVDALRNWPRELEQKKASAQATLTDLEARVKAPFEFGTILADKKTEAVALERALSGADEADKEKAERLAASRALQAKDEEKEDRVPAEAKARRGDPFPGLVGMRQAEVRDLVEPIRRKVALPLEVVASPGQLPVAAAADTKGLYVNGRIYLVADNLAGAWDVEATIAHELQHAGIDVVFGGSFGAREMALQSVVSKNEKLRELASAWRVQYGEAFIKRRMAAGRSRAQAERELTVESNEEAIAYFAQRRIPFNGLKAFVAKIAQALRAQGFKAFPDWLEKATDAEALAFIAGMRRAVEAPESHAIGTRTEPAFMVAWHGGPHDFDRFDVSKIGSGEGAQVYGHGLYFASRREVAEWYRDSVQATGARFRLKGEIITAYTASEGRKIFTPQEYTALEALSTWDEPAGTLDEAIAYAHDGALDTRGADTDYFRDLEAGLRSLRQNHGLTMDPKPKARLYQVDLAPAEDEYLDWDSPMRGQSAKVRAALAKLPSFYRAEKRGHRWGVVDAEGGFQPLSPNSEAHAREAAENMGKGFLRTATGASIYRHLSESLASQHDFDFESGEAPEHIAATMRRLDIPGDVAPGQGYTSFLARVLAEHGDRMTEAERVRWRAELKDSPDAAASALLASIGIPGIKYLDGASRGKGEGAYNYVIFDDRDVKIIAKESRAGFGRVLTHAEFADHLESLPLKDGFGRMTGKEKRALSGAADRWKLTVIDPRTLAPTSAEVDMKYPIIVANGDVLDGRRRRAAAITRGDKAIAAWVGDEGTIVDRLRLPTPKISVRDSWSVYQHKRVSIGDGSIAWVEDGTTASVIDIQASKNVRGRDLLLWLKEATGGKELQAIGVQDRASGFWERMENEGIINYQTEEDWISYFNFGSGKPSRGDFKGAQREPRVGLLDWILKNAGGKWIAAHVTDPLWQRTTSLAARVVPERVKHGVIADYGLPEPYLDARVDREARANQLLRRSKSVLDRIQGLDRAQSRVAYLWMTGQPNLDTETELMAQLPEEARQALRQMKEDVAALGREARDLGLLSEESYQRNNLAYLHRTYLKYEREDAGAKAARRRSATIRGEQFRGRGLRDDAAMAALEAVDPDWWGIKVKDGQADATLKGKKFLRLERRGPAPGVEALEGFESVKPTGKLLEVVYWPMERGEPPATYKAWRRDGEWEARFFDHKGKVGMWRDFTAEERGRMGEIDEVRYAFARTMLGMVRDVEAARFLKWTAAEYSVPTKDQVDARGGTVVEAKDARTTLQTFTAEEWVKVPDGKAAGTNIPKYGALAGRFIPGAMWNDIRATVNAQARGELSALWEALLTGWKISKTALSPAVHTNNVMSNFILADIADVRGRDIVQALATMARAQAGNAEAKALLDRYQDSGAERGSYVSVELKSEIIEPLLKAFQDEEARVASEVGALARAAQIMSLVLHGNLREAGAEMKLSTTGRLAAAPFKKLIEIYGHEDRIFRLAKFLKEVEEGASDRDAGKAARLAFLDYQINAPWIQAARRTALPFIAFSYRAIPLVVQAAVKKPWKIAKYALVAGGLNALAYALLGADGDEDKERRLLPDEFQGDIFGIFPRMMRLPWNDENGSPMFLDVRRWIPVGDVMDTTGSHSAVPLPSWLSLGGPLAMLMEVFTNRAMFTGRPIVFDSDTLAEKVAKLADHQFKFWAPNLPIPNPFGYIGDLAFPDSPVRSGFLQTYATTNVTKALTEQTDAFGRTQDVAQALTSSIGVKVRSYPADEMRTRAQRAAEREIREIDQVIGDLRRQRQMNGISQEQFMRKLNAQAEKKKAIRERLGAKLGVTAD